jgi:hypothetical protein
MVDMFLLVGLFVIFLTIIANFFISAPTSSFFEPLRGADYDDRWRARFNSGGGASAVLVLLVTLALLIVTPIFSVTTMIPFYITTAFIQVSKFLLLLLTLLTLHRVAGFVAAPLLFEAESPVFAPVQGAGWKWPAAAPLYTGFSRLDDDRQTSQVSQVSQVVNPLLSIPEAVFLVVLVFFASSLLLSSSNFILFVAAFELLSLTLYLLATLHLTATSGEAGMKYFILGGIGSGFLVFGTSLIYLISNSVDFLDLYNLLLVSTRLTHTVPYGLLLGVTSLLIGVLFKLGISPFHS